MPPIPNYGLVVNLPLAPEKELQILASLHGKMVCKNPEPPRSHDPALDQTLAYLRKLKLQGKVNTWKDWFDNYEGLAPMQLTAPDVKAVKELISKYGAENVWGGNLYKV